MTTQDLLVQQQRKLMFENMAASSPTRSGSGYHNAETVSGLRVESGSLPSVYVEFPRIL
jgi:hypothetical protein